MHTHLEVFIKESDLDYGVILGVLVLKKKLMTTGDGGMICSDNLELLKDVRAMRWVELTKIIGKPQKTILLQITTQCIGFMKFEH